MNNKIVAPASTTPVTPTNNEPGAESFDQVMKSLDPFKGSAYTDPIDIITANGIIEGMVKRVEEDAKMLKEIMDEE